MSGKNLTDLKKEIADAIHDINQAKLDRADINADIQAIREKMAARGIPKKALDMAMQYLAMDEEKRIGFDVAYALVREAGGLPLQDDLFDAADRLAKDPLPGEEEKTEPKTADVVQIVQIFRAEDEANAGKVVHEPTGKEVGAQN